MSRIIQLLEEYAEARNIQPGEAELVYRNKFRDLFKEVLGIDEPMPALDEEFNRKYVMHRNQFRAEKREVIETL